jgi:hypothetical protein
MKFVNHKVIDGIVMGHYEYTEEDLKAKCADCPKYKTRIEEDRYDVCVIHYCEVKMDNCIKSLN